MSRFLSAVLLTVLAIAVILAALLTIGASSADAITRSIAEIETAKAMQAQASATHSAVNALGAVTVLDKLLQLATLLLLVLIIVAILYILRQRQHILSLQADLTTRQTARLPANTRWAPGPNAGWKKLSSPSLQASTLAQGGENVGAANVGVGPTLQEVTMTALLASIASNLHSPTVGAHGVRPDLPARVNTPDSDDTDIHEATWEDFLQ